MATFGYCSDDGDNRENRGSMKWPLEYLNETKEFMCGLCGQALNANPSHDNIETHFQRCKNSKEAALLMGFKDLLKLNQNLKGLNADLQTRVDQMKAEMMEEIKTELLNIKAEVGKQLEMNKKEINKENMGLISDMETEKEQLKKCKETSDATVSTLINKVNILEDGMKEKIAELNGGVSDTISTIVQSMVEDRLKKETEAIWVQLRKSEGDIQTRTTRLEEKVARLKTGQETLSKQMKTKDRNLQLQKRQLENEDKEMEATQQLVKKQKIFHQEPSMIHQFTFRHQLMMNCFNLVTQSHRFSSSCVWNINGFGLSYAQKTCKMTSEVFQWGLYPVEARAMLQLKEDGCIYVSLHLEDALQDEKNLKNLSSIPQVFYLLKDLSFNPRIHKCYAMGYLFDTAFNFSLDLQTCLGHKSRFVRPKWNSTIAIYVEPFQMTQHVHSYDGMLEWKIENYERRLELRQSYFGFYQKNPYFYTSPRGYRVQVEIFLKEEIKGKRGLTAIISFLTGKFDAELSKSFPHSTTVTLMKRKNPEKNINKTFVEDIKNKKEYEFEICKAEEAANLVDNDTLFCKVVIKAH